MDNIVYEVLMKYIEALTLNGYVAKTDKDKVILLLIIRDLIATDINGELTSEDFDILTSLVYQLFESSCLIGYYDLSTTTLQSTVINTGNMFDMYSLSLSAIINRLDNLEDTFIVTP